MTRENKAGLVMAGSFLALLGTVLVMKSRERATSGNLDPTGAGTRIAMTIPPAGKGTVAEAAGVPIPSPEPKQQKKIPSPASKKEKPPKPDKDTVVPKVDTPGTPAIAPIPGTQPLVPMSEQVSTDQASSADIIPKMETKGTAPPIQQKTVKPSASPPEPEKMPNALLQVKNDAPAIPGISPPLTTPDPAAINTPGSLPMTPNSSAAPLPLLPGGTTPEPQPTPSPVTSVPLPTGSDSLPPLPGSNPPPEGKTPAPKADKAEPQPPLAGSPIPAIKPEKTGNSDKQSPKPPTPGPTEISPPAVPPAPSPPGVGVGAAPANPSEVTPKVEPPAPTPAPMMTPLDPVPPRPTGDTTSPGRPLQQSEFVPTGVSIDSPRGSQPKSDVTTPPVPNPDPNKPAMPVKSEFTRVAPVASLPGYTGETTSPGSLPSGQPLTPPPTGTLHPPAGASPSMSPGVSRVPEPRSIAAPSSSTLPASTAPIARTSAVAVGSGTPFVVPLTPAGVDKYDVTGFKWKQEDNWESVSKSYYNTPVYADALREYNQMYPGQMSDRIKQSGTPEPGIDIVYIPPVRLLELKHRRLIRSLNTN